MPVSLWPPEITPDLCDIYPTAAPGPARDASGGRADDPAAPSLSGFPCSYQPELATDLDIAQAEAAKSNAHVVFTSDPGDLRAGARILVTHLDGRALARPIGLSVNQLVRQGLSLDTSTWRADCTGRA